jgi:lysophospholipid acyltransferase (LPLAT)-like uncharacterized protein
VNRLTPFFLGLLAIFAALFIRLLIFTWRIRLHGPEPNDLPGPFVFCFWHGNQAGLLAHPRVRRAVVMTSLSKDGSLQAEILRRLGFIVVRGSSSRGGAAGLKAVTAEIKRGRDALFAVDGPRGPIHQIKEGALLAAQATGVSLIALTAVADRSIVFHRSWDRYSLPKLFARVDIYRSEPIDSSADMESLRSAVHAAMKPL